jgi:DNA-binding phage protein
VRNDQVYAEWKSGKSLAWLAGKYQRTPQQCGRIVASYHPELEDDTDRALHRGRLESLYEEVQSVIEAPGWKFAPNGRLAEDEDGNPLIDTGAKIEAMKLQLMVLDSGRKLDARDKPVRKILQLDRPAAELEMLAAIAGKRREMEQLARQAGAVRGEVIRELPPGTARPG